MHERRQSHIVLKTIALMPDLNNDGINVQRMGTTGNFANGSLCNLFGIKTNSLGTLTGKEARSYVNYYVTSSFLVLLFELSTEAHLLQAA